MTSKDKIWFIAVDAKKEGPYGILELRRHPFFTPDTLVWKEGFSRWLPARDVPELQKAFEDTPEEEISNDLKTKKVPTPPGDELVIDMREDPPPFYFWLLVSAVILAFVFYQIIWGK
jgi:hypothetical protein